MSHDTSGRSAGAGLAPPAPQQQQQQQQDMRAPFLVYYALAMGLLAERTQGGIDALMPDNEPTGILEAQGGTTRVEVKPRALGYAQNP